MEHIISIDRISDGIIVCIDENGNIYKAKVADVSGTFCEGDMCVAEITDDGKIASLEKDGELTEKRKSEMKHRLRKLFKN